MRINSPILHLGCTTMTRICSTYSGITVQLRVEYPDVPIIGRTKQFSIKKNVFEGSTMKPKVLKTNEDYEMALNHLASHGTA